MRCQWTSCFHQASESEQLHQQQDSLIAHCSSSAIGSAKEPQTRTLLVLEMLKSPSLSSTQRFISATVNNRRSASVPSSPRSRLSGRGARSSCCACSPTRATLFPSPAWSRRGARDRRSQARLTRESDAARGNNERRSGEIRRRRNSTRLLTHTHTHSQDQFLQECEERVRKTQADSFTLGHEHDFCYAPGPLPQYLFII